MKSHDSGALSCLRTFHGKVGVQELGGESQGRIGGPREWGGWGRGGSQCRDEERKGVRAELGDHGCKILGSHPEYGQASWVVFTLSSFRAPIGSCYMLHLTHTDHTWTWHAGRQTGLRVTWYWPSTCIPCSSETSVLGGKAQGGMESFMLVSAVL